MELNEFPVISTYGTSATLKRKVIAWTGQPTYVVRSASTKKGAPLLQTKGFSPVAYDRTIIQHYLTLAFFRSKTLKYEYEFKQGKTIVAEVSRLRHQEHKQQACCCFLKLFTF
jgi:hypothetical protein